MLKPVKSALAGVVCSLSLILSVPALAGQVELVSRAAPDQVSDTATGAESSLLFPVLLSADGRYLVFGSSADNLVAGQDDPRKSFDFFLRDRVAGTTVLVSRSQASPVTAAGGVVAAALSADGRYVAWSSSATNVAPGQSADSLVNVFLFDRTKGTNRLLGPGDGPKAFSQDGRYLFYLDQTTAYLYDLSAGAATRIAPPDPAYLTATAQSLSADGRYATFTGTVSGQIHVRVYDRVTRALEDVGDGSGAVLSADGRFVAFLSGSPTRVPGQVDTNTGSDAFLYDRTAKTTTLVSRSRLSALRAGDRPLPTQTLALSADGHYLAFVTRSTDVVPNQGPTDANFVLFDRVANTLKLAEPVLGFLYTDHPDSPLFSRDGRSLLFVSNAPHIIPGQASPGPRNVFLYDIPSGAVRLLSPSTGGSGTGGNGDSFDAALSADGRVAAFFSIATDLVAGLRDNNETEDLFAYSAGTGALEAITVRADPSATPARGSAPSAVSADGRWIAYVSDASHLVSGQVDHQNRVLDSRSDVFLYDGVTRTSQLVSRRNGTAATAGDDSSWNPLMTPDGRYVAFASRADDLTADPVFGQNVFLFDRLAGSSVLVSRSAAKPGGASGTSFPGGLSADGRYFAFTSTATDLVPGQVAPANGSSTNVYLYDRVAGTVTLVSHAAASPQQTSGSAQSPDLSADGRYLLFYSFGTDLVPGETGPGGNLFLWDRATGVSSLVTHARSAATAGGGGSVSSFSLSADGRYVAYVSTQPDLTADPGGDLGNLYLYDRTTGTNTLLVPFFVPSNIRQAVISADGRTVAFVSDGGNLVPGQSGPPGAQQVFLYDLATRTITLASRDGSSPTTGRAGISSLPALSTDGRYVAYLSGKVPLDIFRFDRMTGATVLLDPSLRTSQAAGGAGEPLISADGQTVAFTSTSPDLVDGDRNGDQQDAFVYRTTPLAPPPGPVAVTPCTLLDTRQTGPALRSNVRKSVKAAGTCGVPATVMSVVVKVTALQGTGKGNLRLYSGSSSTLAGTLRFARSQTVSATFTVPVGADGTIAILPFVGGKGTVQAAVEVDAYNP
ncbi:MAG TPA: hypothetical protein VGP73_16895 [Thermoanaerobaculia bacterium]